ncbi:LysR family transcriptional regulator [Pseudoduganella sp. FT26W]|uniref:LysR family transcriptional regulator n=1 Tax=Duganella aquatilis TaxID=2666082 RepID=A0A844D9Z4_9BURK|nr:LysR family transcriptional regulator [Duganella aquatilis]MRW84169.1 LysR family transcriptional regulator [Duganella aquatilis]
MEWSDIRVFLQVARSGRMAEASRLLRMDDSTISRRIARLERDAGVVLFDRAAKRLNLTEEGCKLLAAAEKMEAIVIRDVQALAERRQGISGKVRIGTSEGFGSHYLAQRLPTILHQYPELEIELVAVQRTYSLGMREADIVITMDRPNSGDIRLRKLCDSRLHIYASAEFLARRPAPLSIADLTDALWCGYIQELLFTEILDMLTFGDTVIMPRYRTNSLTAQLAAVLGGEALTVLPTYLAAHYPALQPVLAQSVRIDMSYWMSVHNDLARSPRVRAVMNAIEQLVASERHLCWPASV